MSLHLISIVKNSRHTVHPHLRKKWCQMYDLRDRSYKVHKNVHIKMHKTQNLEHDFIVIVATVILAISRLVDELSLILCLYSL